MRAGRLLAAFAAAAALAVPLVPTAARAATPTAAAPATLVVAPHGGGVVRDGSPMDVEVLVTNTGTAALPAGRLSLSLGNVPVASSAALLADLRTLPGQPQGYRLTRTSARTPALAVDASARIEVRIPAKDLDETLTSANGSRLLDVQLRAGDRVAIGRSALTRMSSAAPRVGFGTVVPITAPGGTSGVVDATTQSALTADGGDWSAALRAATAMPEATIALDPAVPASVRLLGSDAPGAATSFLDALGSAGNETVELPYADGDVTLERAAGARTIVAPGSFAGAGTVGATTSGPSATPTPASTPTSGAPTSSDDLLAWDWSRTKVVWPVPGTTSAGDLGALSGAGTLLLGSGDLQDTAARVAAGPLADVSGHRVLVADAVLSGLLAAAAGGGPTGRSATASLTAALATDATSGAVPAVLAVAGRGADAEGLARVLGLLAAQRWIRGESLSTLAAQTDPASVRLKPGSVPASRAATGRQLLAAEQQVQRVSKAAADPAAVAGPYRLAVLGALSAAWRGAEQAWPGAAAAVTAELTAMPDRVMIEDSDDNTVSTDGSLQVGISNRLQQAVKVEVGATVNNGRLRFTAPAMVTVPAAPAGGETTAVTKLSFHSISNGRSTVTLSLSTPAGVPFGRSVQRTVTVQAGFDTVVAVVLLSALGLLLALGVYRNVIRRRRPRAEAT